MQESATDTVASGRNDGGGRQYDEDRAFLNAPVNAERPAEQAGDGNPVKIRTADLHIYYDDFHAIKGVTSEIRDHAITALIGPSGCGKSTYLRALNRMNDEILGARVEGEVLLDGVDIYEPGTDLVTLRRRVGQVFQQPNPFPMSIYDNIAYGPRTHGVRSRAKLDDTVERCLRDAAIWDEVKDRLKKPALGLSFHCTGVLALSLELALIILQRMPAGIRSFFAKR